jgi:hypothetical protein
MTDALVDPDVQVSAVDLPPAQPPSDPTDPAPAPAFPILMRFDFERFAAFAYDRDIRLGVDWFRAHRVQHVSETPDGIRAWIGLGVGDQAAAGVLEVFAPPDRETEPVAVRLERGEDWDTDRLEPFVIAAVLAYQKRFAVPPELLEDVAARHRTLRAERGVQEVKVVPPEGAEGQPWGVWQAWSVGSRRPSPWASYRVELRSLDLRLNGCTCPDYRLSGLGMCKHIVAVLHHLREKRPPAQPDMRIHLAPRPREDGGCEWVVLARASQAQALAPVLPNAWRVPMDTFPVEDRVEGGHESWVTLEEGRVAWQLPTDDPETVLAVLRRLRADGRLHQAADMDGELDRLINAQRMENRERQQAQRWRQGGEVVPGLRREPYPYQVEGIGFLLRRGRALLADEMGLGKTLQAIGAALWMHQQRQVDRILVVCPASLVGQWQREIEEATGHPAWPYRSRSGLERRLLSEGPLWVIASYEKVREKFDVFQDLLRPQLIIFDEAQMLKNLTSRRAQFLAALHAPHVFVLTGTPIENRLLELYALMQLVDPRILGPLWRFKTEYCVLNAAEVPLAYRNLGHLRARIEPWLLRRRRADVLTQLPPRMDEVLWVEMTSRQRNHHDETVAKVARLAARAAVQKPTPGESLILMSLLEKLRQICNGAFLAERSAEPVPRTGQPWSEEDEALRDAARAANRRRLQDALAPGQVPKVDLALVLVEGHLQAGRKVVVFSQWLEMLHLLETRLRTELGVGVARLDGSLSAGQRSTLVQLFQEGDSVQVLLLSRAGDTGLNLQTASALIHMETPWNPAVLEQRSSRIYRIGQTRDVIIQRIVTMDAYEMAVSNLLEQKRALAREVLDGGGDLAETRDQTLAVKAFLAWQQSQHHVDPDERRLEDDPVTDTPVDEDAADASAWADTPGAFDTSVEPPAAEPMELTGYDGAYVEEDDTPGNDPPEPSATAPSRLPPVQISLLGGLLPPPEPRHARAPAPRPRPPAAPRSGAASSHPPLTRDARFASAPLLHAAGQPAMALELLVQALLDRAGAHAGEPAPRNGDLWRWFVTWGLPTGAVSMHDAHLLGEAADALTLEPGPARDAAVEAAWQGVITLLPSEEI